MGGASPTLGGRGGDPNTQDRDEIWHAFSGVEESTVSIDELAHRKKCYFGVGGTP